MHRKNIYYFDTPDVFRVFYRNESRYTFEEMVFHKNGIVNEKYPAVNKGIYHLHYSRWQQFFPKEQILVLDGEAFAKDPYPILKEVETFLGLKPHIKRRHVAWSNKKQFFCPKPNGKMECMSNNKGRKHPVLSRSTLDTIRDYYRPHNKIFEGLINYTFSLDLEFKQH